MTNKRKTLHPADMLRKKQRKKELEKVRTLPLSLQTQLGRVCFECAIARFCKAASNPCNAFVGKLVRVRRICI